jgi:hypothetical protein
MLNRELQVEHWNKAVKVGMDVWLRLDDGAEVLTKTSSEAKVLGGHSAVVWLDGFSGCWALSRVRLANGKWGSDE